MFAVPHTRTSSVLAVFDIDSASVGAGVVYAGGESPELLWSVRLPHATVHDADYAHFVRSMLATLVEAGMKLATEGLPQVIAQRGVRMSDVHTVCILGAPWFMGATYRDTITGDDVLVTKELITEHTDKLLTTLLASEENERFAALMQDAHVLETLLMDTRLNGYPTERYLGRRASSFSFAAWFSAVSPDVESQVHEVLSKILPNSNVSYTTASRTFFEIVRTRLPRSMRLLLVDVGGEVTAISLIEHRAIQRSAVVPYGGNHLNRAISPNTSQSVGKLSVLASKNVPASDLPPGLSTALEAWRSTFRSACIELAQGITLPRNAVLVTDRVWQPWYSGILKEAWEQPGLRASVGFHTLPLVPEVQAKDNASDTRLYMEAQGLVRVTSGS